MRFGACAFGAILLTFLPASPASASCDDVIYRIWQGGDSTFYDQGAEIPLEIGKESHFYLHYRSRSPSPYSTSAEMGYPRSMGLGGPRPEDILEVVELKAQSSQDVDDGRIVLQGKKAGLTSLGYRMLEVRHPGSIDQVPEPCRTGVLNFRVGDAGGDEDPAAPNPVPNPVPPSAEPAMIASQELVANLYAGILRRRNTENIPREHVLVAHERGHAGLVDLAADMLKSAEFSGSAIERTRDAHRDLGPNSSDQEVLARLLTDMYQTLYGSGAAVDEREHERNVNNLDICLSTFSNRVKACGDLGRSLVANGAYVRQHQDQLEKIHGAKGMRLDRSRNGG